MRSSSCYKCFILLPLQCTRGSNVYTRWHPCLGTVREAGPLSAREASKAGPCAIMSWRLSYRVGAIKHTSFLLNIESMVQLEISCQRQSGDSNLRLPFHTKCISLLEVSKGNKACICSYEKWRKTHTLDSPFCLRHNLEMQCKAEEVFFNCSHPGSTSL